MKPIFALAFLVSFSAFAEIDGANIKCYEALQQNQERTLAYAFREIENNLLEIRYPENIGNLPLETHLDGCLGETAPGEEILFYACRGEGQEIHNLIPVEVSGTEVEDRTVYCERRILNWLD